MDIDEKTRQIIEREYQKIIKETNAEIDKRTEELKNSGKLKITGLDGHKDLFKDINDKAKERIRVLGEKYGIKVNF